MESMLHYLHVLAAGLVVGKVTLLSFVVAPILARQLDAEAFSRVVRQLFPAYYAMGMGAALVGLSASGGLGLVLGPSATRAVVLGL